jgi:GGDEF domain-containing protein
MNKNVPDITNQIHDITDKTEQQPIYLDLQEQEEYSSVKNHRSTSFDVKDTVIFEIAKEISRSETVKDLYDTLIFTVMGQLGSVSASIIEPSPNTTQRWILGEHHGSKLRNRNLTFKSNGSILASIINQNIPIRLRTFENKRDTVEEYQKFFSLGAHIAMPIVYNKSTPFIFLLGEKLEIEDYNDEELTFIKTISELTSVIYSKIQQIDKLQNELFDLKIMEERLDRIDQYESEVRSTEFDNINDIIQSEMKSLNVNSYAFFLFNEVTNRYDVKYTDHEDSLGLLKSGFSIGNDNALILYCSRQNDYAEIDDPVSSDILRKVFPRDFLIKVNVFGILPYQIQGHLAGILLILRIDIETFEKNVSQVKRFGRFVFSQLYIREQLIYKNSYIDTLQPVLSRMRKDFKGCILLGIPMTIAVFKISGYSNISTKISLTKLPELQKKIRQTVEYSVSETDFAFRISHNEFVVVLEGKTKKQSNKIAATVKHNVEKISKEFSVTYSVHEYPGEKQHFDVILEGVF